LACISGSPHEYYGSLILIGHVKAWIEMEKRGQGYVLLSDDDLSSFEVGVVDPARATCPGSNRLPDSLVPVNITPSIHRNFEMWKTPDQIAPPIKMVIQRTSVPLFLDEGGRLDGIELRRILVNLSF
jgi:hypothetical protein